MHKLSNNETDVTKTEQDRFLIEDVFKEAVVFEPDNDAEREGRLITDISCNLPDTLIGDRDKLLELIKNVLGNSLRFAGSNCITMRVRAAGTDEHERILVSVEIKGAKTIPEISAARELARRIDGTIEVASEPDAGTSINIFIPFTQFPGASTIGQKCAKTQFVNLRSLVVGGSSFERRMFNLFLASQKIKPWFAGGFEEALEIVKSRRAQGIFFDLIIADLYSYETEGLDFANKTSELLQKGPKFLFVSPNNQESFPEHKRFEAVFMKTPFTPSELSAKITAALYLGASADNVSAAGIRALVVDDDSVNQIVIKGMLEMYGIKTETAVNGKECLHMLDDGCFDLIIMDINMPVMTGHEAAAAIRSSEKSYKNVPVIAMTASVTEDEEKKFIEEGMNGYIAKPVNSKKLYAELLKVIPEKASSISAAIPAADAHPVSPSGTVQPDTSDIPHIEGIDITDGLKRFINKTERYKKALLGFAEELSEDIIELHMLISDGEFAKASALAHRIKGAAGNLGAKNLHLAASGLEISLKDSENIETLHLNFKSCAETVINGVNKAFDKQSGGKPAKKKDKGSEAEAISILGRLEQSIGEFDPVLSEKITAELLNKEWENFDGDSLNEIAALIEGYQYDKASIKIASILRGRG